MGAGRTGSRILQPTELENGIMKKLTLDVDTLQVQSFATAADKNAEIGTVHGFVKKTGFDDTNCSAIDACASALGCTFNCTADPRECGKTYDPNQCPSIIDACPTRIDCTPVYPC
jgi:hypothetical protein